MIINLTNHPSSAWSTEQMKAASQYGEIIDYPFPQVHPEVGEEEIRIQATDIVNDIINKYGKNEITVHLMGEFTMTVALFKEFSLYNITCIASTTERIVNETVPGKKSVEFKFVRFRKYS